MNESLIAYYLEAVAIAKARVEHSKKRTNRTEQQEISLQEDINTLEFYQKTLEKVKASKRELCFDNAEECFAQQKELKARLIKGGVNFESNETENECTVIPFIKAAFDKGQVEQAEIKKARVINYRNQTARVIRDYRKGRVCITDVSLSMEEACHLLRENGGKMFNAKTARCFLSASNLRIFNYEYFTGIN